MEVNITTVTATKKWAKAYSRLRPKIRHLQESIAGLNLNDDYCEVLQIIFHDADSGEGCEADGFVRADRLTRKEKVKQVIMLLPSGFSFKPEEDDALYSAVMERVISAVNRSPLRDENKALIAETIRMQI